jgi:hypothetical protein
MAMLGAFAFKVFVQGLLGAGLTIKLASSKKAIAVIVVGLLWIICLLASSQENRWKVLVPVYLIVSSMALPLIGRDEAQMFKSLNTFDLRGERYFLLASCMFAYLVAYTLECLLRSEPIKVVALLAIFAGGLHGNFRVERFSDLDWKTNAKCIDAWVRAQRSGKPTLAVSVPVNPPGWGRIDLPSLGSEDPR